MYETDNNQNQYDDERELRHAMQKLRLKKKHARQFYEDSFVNAQDQNPVTGFFNDRVRNHRKYKKRRKRAGKAGKWLVKAILYGGIGIMILILMLSMYACTIVFMEPFAGRTAIAYMSEPKDIDSVELAFSSLEADIEEQVQKAESSHPGYDEYRYSLGTIGHNPLTLASYLSSKYTEYTSGKVSGDLRQIKDEMYNLQFIPSTETYLVYELRTGVNIYDVTETVTNEDGTTSEVTITKSESYIYYEPVEHTSYILTVMLAVTPMETVVASHMDADMNDAYEMYMFSGGGLQVFGNPLVTQWINSVQSYYGYRYNSYGTKELHRGIDITAYPGTKVYATHDGVVSTSYDATYGYTLAIAGADGATTQFGHLSWLAVAGGSSVERGDLIGTVGYTGHAGQNHLHIEVKFKGEYVNPVFYVSSY